MDTYGNRYWRFGRCLIAVPLGAIIGFLVVKAVQVPYVSEAYVLLLAYSSLMSPSTKLLRGSIGRVLVGCFALAFWRCS